jgi:membrane associated rhomboid family serine protease
VIPLKDNVPTRSTPVVTIGLILACTIVWIWEVQGGVNREVFHYGYYPCTVEGPCDPRLVPPDHLSWWEGTLTSMFMHGGWLHIIGNMLFLWIFGNNVEDALGRVRFFLWYIAGGIAATALQTFVTLQFGNAQEASIPNIGASGAIAAVLGAYLLLLPRASVLTAIFLGFFFFIQEIPAIFFLGIWFVFQLWQGGWGVVHPDQGGGVAFFAHVGGFAFGLVTVYLVAKRRPLQPRW